TTAPRSGSSSPTCTGGRASNGCARSNTSWRTGAASGRTAATTTWPTRGASSATPIRRSRARARPECGFPHARGRMLAKFARMLTTACVVLPCLAFVLGYAFARRRAVPERPRDREAAFTTLHLAALAAPALRAGLNRDSARKAVRHPHALLGTYAVAITSTEAALAWDGPCTDDVLTYARPALASGRAQVFAAEPSGAVVAPLTVAGTVGGTLAAFDHELRGALVRMVGQVAGWMSGQLELAELDSSRRRALEADMRALRAQISPHFVHNALTTIASFVRTDPARARGLLLDFADFARYALRRKHDF